jgi:uncharacterized protein with PIN domain
MESDMDIVIDTSALIAVIVEEPERTKIIELTTGNTLIAPGSIPWEIGNEVPSIKAKITTKEIVDIVREGRER